MRRFTSFLLGLFTGAVLGSALGLLLTPESGSDFRNRVQGFLTKLKTEVQQAMTERRAELETELENLRNPTQPHQA